MIALFILLNDGMCRHNFRVVQRILYLASIRKVAAAVPVTGRQGA